MPFVLCADFSLFPDNLVLGPAFTLSGLDFQDAAGAGGPSFVNTTQGQNGLQFPDAGIEVTLPISVPWARLHAGQFNSPYLIESIDSNGTVAAALNVNKPNSYFFVNLPKGDLAALRFTGGGNEGVIVSLCILVP